MRTPLQYCGGEGKLPLCPVMCGSTESELGNRSPSGIHYSSTVPLGCSANPLNFLLSDFNGILGTPTPILAAQLPIPPLRRRTFSMYVLVLVAILVPGRGLMVIL